MRSFKPALLLACLAATAATAVPAALATPVDVSFVNSPGFSDAGSAGWERDANLLSLATCRRWARATCRPIRC